MKADEAYELARKQLQPTSALVEPLLEVVFDAVKAAAEKGQFTVDISLPFRPKGPGLFQWSDTVGEAVVDALKDLGYTVAVVRATKATRDSEGNLSYSGYTVWSIGWQPFVK